MSNSVSTWKKSLSSWVLQILFPMKCLLCGRILLPNELPADEVCICKDCLPRGAFAIQPIHSSISQPIPESLSQPTPTIAIAIGKSFLGPEKVKVDGVFAPFEYEEHTRDAIIRFKFYGREFYAHTFAYAILQALTPCLGCFDTIVPVPLSRGRLKTRGYNQAELIAKELTCYTGVPTLRNALLKVKETDKQSRSAGIDRVKNVTGVFCVGKKNDGESLVNGRHILLIDDILTTGSTMGECAKVLATAGAVSVYCAAIAVTTHNTRLKYVKKC